MSSYFYNDIRETGLCALTTVLYHTIHILYDQEKIIKLPKLWNKIQFGFQFNMTYLELQL